MDSSAHTPYIALRAHKLLWWKEVECSDPWAGWIEGCEAEITEDDVRIWILRGDFFAEEDIVGFEIAVDDVLPAGWGPCSLGGAFDEAVVEERETLRYLGEDVPEEIFGDDAGGELGQVSASTVLV